MQTRALTPTVAIRAPQPKPEAADRWPVRASLLFVLVASVLLWGGLILLGRLLFSYFAAGN